MLWMILLAGTAGVCLGVPVTGSRDLRAGPLSHSNRISVTLDFEIDEADKPSAVIVSEILPAGWKLIPGSARPRAISYDPSTREIKWLFVDGLGMNITDASMDIQYQAAFSPSQLRQKPFSGSIKYNPGHVAAAIGGETRLTRSLDSSAVGQGPLEARSRFPTQPSAL